MYIYVYMYICVYIYIYNSLTPFCGWGATASRLYRANKRRQFTFYQKFLVLVRSISEGWKAEMILKSSSGFELVFQPSYYQIQIIVTIQADSIMTLNCELFQSEFSVLSGRLIKNMFPLHICRPNDYTIEIIFLVQIQIYNILLMFFPLFSNVFTNILKIYELPKIYNKVLKKLLTIIIY